MRRIVLTFCVLFFGGWSFAQKSIDRYASCSEFETHKAGEFFVTNLMPDMALKQRVNPQKGNEFFEMEDTAYRAWLQTTNTVIMVDSLAIKNYNQYSMEFQVQSIYHITHKADSFTVIRAYDAYQYGTEVQCIFIVFKLMDGQYNLFSVYMVMEPEKFRHEGERVKVYFRKNELKLRGTSLILLRNPNWI